MEIIPAIDLRDGKVVRLFRGEADRQKSYSENPVEVSARFFSFGARRIHIVNLNGAFEEDDKKNIQAILEIRKRTKVFLEIGGGARSLEKARRYFEMGADAVILSTVFFANRSEFEKITNAFPGKIIASADVKSASSGGDGVKNDFVFIKGWREASDFSLKKYLDEIKEYGISEVVVTRISRDGTLEGVDDNFYKKACGLTNLSVIASGGVGSLKDVEILSNTPVKGVVIGKAIYEGKINLKEAIEKYGGG